MREFGKNILMYTEGSLLTIFGVFRMIFTLEDSIK